MDPRPSGVIILDIDEAMATKDTRTEIKRCYPHVGTPLIRTHEVAEGEGHQNIMKLMPMVNKMFMDPSDESQRFWDAIMERWNHALFYNLGNAMKIYNRRQREIDDGMELYFDSLNLILDDGNGNGEYTISFVLNSNSDLDPDDAAPLATLARNKMVRDEFGEGVRKVLIPSQEFYAIQKAAGDAARERKLEAERLAAEKAAEEEAAKLAAMREEAAENFLEDPDEAYEEEERKFETWTERMSHFEFPDLDFDVDFRYWDICLPDGTTRMYDSAEDALVDGVPEEIAQMITEKINPTPEPEVEVETEVTEAEIAEAEIDAEAGADETVEAGDEIA